MVGQMLFVGDPVVDLLVRIKSSLLREHEIEPAGCVPISSKALQALLQIFKAQQLSVRCGPRLQAGLHAALLTLQELA